MKGNKKEKKVNKKLRVIVYGAVLIGVIAAGSAAVVIHNGGENVKNNVSDKSNTKDLNKAILTDKKVLENNIIFKTTDGTNIAATKKENINVDEMKDSEVKFYYIEKDNGAMELHFIKKTPDMNDTLANIIENKIKQSNNLRIDVSYSIFNSDDSVDIKDNLYSYLYDNSKKTVELSDASDNKNIYTVGDVIDNSNFNIVDFDNPFTFCKSYFENEGFNFDIKTAHPKYEDTIQNDYLLDNEKFDFEKYKDFLKINNIDESDVSNVKLQTCIVLNDYKNIQDAYLTFVDAEWTMDFNENDTLQIHLLYSLS